MIPLIPVSQHADIMECAMRPDSRFVSEKSVSGQNVTFVQLGNSYFFTLEPAMTWIDCWMALAAEGATLARLYTNEVMQLATKEETVE